MILSFLSNWIIKLLSCYKNLYLYYYTIKLFVTIESLDFVLELVFYKRFYLNYCLSDCLKIIESFSLYRKTLEHKNIAIRLFLSSYTIFVIKILLKYDISV